MWCSLLQVYCSVLLQRIAVCAVRYNQHDCPNTTATANEGFFAEIHVSYADIHGSFVETRGSFTKIHGSFAKHTHHRAQHRDILQKYELVQYVGLFCEKYTALLRYGFHLCKCTRKDTSRSKDDFHHANVTIHSYT